MSVFHYVLDEVSSTVISVATTGLIAWVIWLATLSHESKKIRQLLSDPGRQFIFHYRGDAQPELKKIITFNVDGSVGSGYNNNESTWQIRFGKLEIFNSDKILYSKFKWNKDLGKLVHVNDPNLPSVMGQYITPMFIKPQENQDGQ